ncbi:MAG: ABC transporter permease subunit [Thermomicrobiales bacterium]
MRPRMILALTQKEMRDALRNRWFIAYASAFVVLSMALALLILSSASYSGISGFGRTAAGLVNLVLFLAPLMGLTLGAQALAGERERGTLGYLLAQPISVAEYFASKFLGLALALAGAIMVGFGLSTLILVLAGNGGGEAFVGLTLLTVLLAWVSLSLGYLISSRNRRTATAFGVAIVVWLFLALAGGLGLMGTAVVLQLGPGTLLAITILNPLESYRIAAIYFLRGSLELLGPAGLVAERRLGDWTGLVLIAVLLVWLLAPLGLAYRTLGREVRR